MSAAALQGDPFDLERFVRAQEPVYDRVLTELRRGQKTSHWMWCIFPQIAGLGHSAMAMRYAVGSADETRAYLAHPVLGARLLECTQLVVNARDQSLEDILGPVDSVKFRSSMTLFAAIAPDKPLFGEALETYFSGEPDRLTLERLAALKLPARPT